MYVQQSGGGHRIGPPWAAQRRHEGSRRAGWWFWFPFLFGASFLLGGIGFIVFGGVSNPWSGGTVTAGIAWAAVGLVSLGVAWWAWRDIHSPDPDAETWIPGEVSDEVEAELRVTGVPGHATIRRFVYKAGSTFEGTTLVEIHLDVTTTLGGTTPVVHESRVPLAVTDRLGAGATVPVRISSTDPSKLLVEWTGLVPATPGGQG